MTGLISTLLLFPLFKKLFNFRYDGLEKISKNENYIFAMNHQSGLDLLLALGVLVPYTKRPLSIVVNQRVYDFPLLTPFFKRWQAIRIPNKENKEKRSAILEAKKCLEKGNNVLIFPEGESIGGTIGEPTRAYTGVMQLAIMSKKKVIPVGINGSYHAWKFPAHIALRSGMIKIPKGKKSLYKQKFRIKLIEYIYNIFELNFRHPVKMKFGKSFDLGENYKLNLSKFSENNKKALRQMTTNLMKQIAALAGQKYRYDC